MEDGSRSRLADKRVHEWFLREQARSEREAQSQVEPVGRSKRVLTVSRQYGAGGHTIANLVAQQLGSDWEIWDKEIIEEVARSARVRAEMVETMDERTQTWIEQVVRNIFGVKTIEAFQYRHHLAQVLLALAQQGNKIFIGRGANFVLTDAFNIRLWASESYRVQAMMSRNKLSHDEAVKNVHQVDKERADFTRSVFDRDINDPQGYDMVLRTDEMGEGACVAAVLAAARERFGLPR